MTVLALKTSLWDDQWSFAAKSKRGVEKRDVDKGNINFAGEQGLRGQVSTHSHSNANVLGAHDIRRTRHISNTSNKTFFKLGRGAKALTLKFKL